MDRLNRSDLSILPPEAISRGETITKFSELKIPQSVFKLAQLATLAEGKY
jgi:hypothetical protein